MTDSMNSLQLRDRVSPMPTPAMGRLEQTTFGNRLTLAIEHYRLAERFDALLHGEDMIKFHVRLSGRRLLTFDGRDMMALEGTSTAVLLHELDMPKTDHILAGHDEVSIT